MAIAERQLTAIPEELALADTLLANLYHPARPTYRMMGGTVRFVGKAAHYDGRDMIDGPLTYAMRKEMHRRGIGDLECSQFEAELVDTAAASLLAKTDAPFEASTFDEAARLVVAHTIDTGDHDAERAARLVNGWEAQSWV